MAKRGKSQFVGSSGQYFVAYALAVRQIHASLTLGNAPSVDILAASVDGSRTLAIQVKTSRDAYRRNRYGNEGFEWDVNVGVIGNHAESFWYALVDLQESDNSWNPRVFFVPSRWVSEFVKPDFSRYMYFLPKTMIDRTMDRWDLVQKYLDGDPEAIAWARDWPKNELVSWGSDT